MATAFVAVTFVVMAMTTAFFTTTVVFAWFVKSFFVVFFLFFVVLQIILHVVEGAQCINQLLSPQHSEVFLTNGQLIVHRFVQSQLENKNKVFDILINISQIFRYGLLDRLVAVYHILHKYVQIIILVSH